MFKRIKCTLNFHSFEEVETLSDQAVRLRCTDCKKEFAYHHVLGLLTPMDIGTEKFYESFKKIERASKQESDYAKMKRDVV